MEELVMVDNLVAVAVGSVVVAVGSMMATTTKVFDSIWRVFSVVRSSRKLPVYVCATGRCLENLRWPIIK